MSRFLIFLFRGRFSFNLCSFSSIAVCCLLAFSNFSLTKQMDLSSVYDSIKQTWNEKWWGEMERSHNWKLHRFSSCAALFLYNSQQGRAETLRCAYGIYVRSTLLLKINWNTWNATKSQNDCYVCASEQFNLKTGCGVKETKSASHTMATEKTYRNFQQFHFKSPIHRTLIKLITMGFHIPSLSLFMMTRPDCVTLLLSLHVHWIFIEMEANGKSSKRSILWAPAEIIQSRYGAKLMSRSFIL